MNTIETFTCSHSHIFDWTEQEVTSPYSLEENGHIGIMIRDFVASGNGEKATEVFKKTRSAHRVNTPLSYNSQLLRLYQVIGLLYAIYYKMLESADDLVPINTVKDIYLKRCQPHQDLTQLDTIAIEMLLAFSEVAKAHQPYDSYNTLIQKSIVFIKNNLKSKLSLKDVSSALHVNACYLSSIFKKETGKSMTIFITELKVEEAKNLLSHTHMTISNICYELGYDNPSYFTEVFKKITGVTPKDYKIQSSQ